MEKKNDIISVSSGVTAEFGPRKGIFEEGRDKLGRPFEKKMGYIQRKKFCVLPHSA